ncbi:DUF4240 domain-containing protein [Hymenobacter lucidus]|uniref:DUF4240 domain-containing protein n=1 Tax=Hymenobacter lucidus TaxID=2880930 RepID=A0ABS8AMK6_9BACT|nr:DUF4240 domain-containing protein [Hymenobacter lucidus]MCB2407420.1 DUF4240 domain-containing protein [Hymenobacter lucidus]
MEIQQFWQLIEAAKKKSGGDIEEQAELLTEKLATLSMDEILEFDRIFTQLLHAAYQSKLWAAAYLILGGCSDDGFEYFRAWLIARGQKVYETAVADADGLAKLIKQDDAEEAEAESMLYVASTAYEQKTGKDDFHELAPLPPSLPTLDLSWSDDEKLLSELLPKLFKKFG